MKLSQTVQTIGLTNFIRGTSFFSYTLFVQKINHSLNYIWLLARIDKASRPYLESILSQIQIIQTALKVRRNLEGLLYLFVVDVDDVTGPDAQLVVHVGSVVVKRSARADAWGVATCRSGAAKMFKIRK